MSQKTNSHMSGDCNTELRVGSPDPSTEDIAKECARLVLELEGRLLQLPHLHNEAIKVALRIGQLLCIAKGLVAHGEWLSWLKTSVPHISQPTASRYMRIAKVGETADGTRSLATFGLVKALQLNSDTKRTRPAVSSSEAVMCRATKTLKRLVDWVSERCQSSLSKAETTQLLRWHNEIGLMMKAIDGAIAEMAAGRSSQCLELTSVATVTPFMKGLGTGAKRKPRGHSPRAFAKTS